MRAEVRARSLRSSDARRQVQLEQVGVLVQRERKNVQKTLTHNKEAALRNFLRATNDRDRFLMRLSVSQWRSIVKGEKQLSANKQELIGKVSLLLRRQQKPDVLKLTLMCWFNFVVKSREVVRVQRQQEKLAMYFDADKQVVLQQACMSTWARYSSHLAQSIAFLNMSDKVFLSYIWLSWKSGVTTGKCVVQQQREHLPELAEAIASLCDRAVSANLKKFVMRAWSIDVKRRRATVKQICRIASRTVGSLMRLSFLSWVSSIQQSKAVEIDSAFTDTRTRSKDARMQITFAWDGFVSRYVDETWGFLLQLTLYAWIATVRQSKHTASVNACTSTEMKMLNHSEMVFGSYSQEIHRATVRLCWLAWRSSRDTARGSQCASASAAQQIQALRNELEAEHRIRIARVGQVVLDLKEMNKSEVGTSSFAFSRWSMASRLSRLEGRSARHGEILFSRHAVILQCAFMRLCWLSWLSYLEVVREHSRAERIEKATNKTSSTDRRARALRAGQAIIDLSQTVGSDITATVAILRWSVAVLLSKSSNGTAAQVTSGCDRRRFAAQLALFADIRFRSMWDIFTRTVFERWRSKSQQFIGNLERRKSLIEEKNGAATVKGDALEKGQQQWDTKQTRWIEVNGNNGHKKVSEIPISGDDGEDDRQQISDVSPMQTKSNPSKRRDHQHLMSFTQGVSMRREMNGDGCNLSSSVTIRLIWQSWASVQRNRRIHSAAFNKGATALIRTNDRLMTNMVVSRWRSFVTDVQTERLAEVRWAGNYQYAKTAVMELYEEKESMRALLRDRDEIVEHLKEQLMEATSKMDRVYEVAETNEMLHQELLRQQERTDMLSQRVADLMLFRSARGAVEMAGTANQFGSKFLRTIMLTQAQKSTILFQLIFLSWSIIVKLPKQPPVAQAEPAEDTEERMMGEMLSLEEFVQPAEEKKEFAFQVGNWLISYYTKAARLRSCMLLWISITMRSRQARKAKKAADWVLAVASNKENLYTKQSYFWAWAAFGMDADDPVRGNSRRNSHHHHEDHIGESF